MDGVPTTPGTGPDGRMESGDTYLLRGSKTRRTSRCAAWAGGRSIATFMQLL